MQAFVPKNRKPRFEVELHIIDLNNVPLVSGSAFVKWHLPSSAAAEHRGRTPKTPIKDHKVAWYHSATFTTRLIIDKTGLLHDSEIGFEIIQEYSSGARADRITLGTLRLNLAEYVEGGEEVTEDGSSYIVRRYLMQESKINSTIKIGFSMRQLDGDRNFVCPTLKTAPVFGGIAGIMTNSETVDPNSSEEGLPSSMANQKAKDFSEMQDMYRKSLAASWFSHMHELPADQCIEDIFSGGDGWGKHHDGKLPSNVPPAASNRVQSATASRSTFTRGLARSSHNRRSSKDLQKYGRSESSSTRGSAMDAAPSQISSSEESRNPSARLREVSEFDLLQDLSSWRIADSSSSRTHDLGLPRAAGKVV